MREIICKTDVQREAGFLYYICFDIDDKLLIGRAVLKRGGKKNKKRIDQKIEVKSKRLQAKEKKLKKIEREIEKLNKEKGKIKINIVSEAISDDAKITKSELQNGNEMVKLLVSEEKPTEEKNTEEIIPLDEWAKYIAEDNRLDEEKITYGEEESHGQ